MAEIELARGYVGGQMELGNQVQDVEVGILGDEILAIESTPLEKFLEPLAGDVVRHTEKIRCVAEEGRQGEVIHEHISKIN
jgi:hypothetical protein